MGVAADCTYVQKYGSAQNATQQILHDWNTASALYKVWLICVLFSVAALQYHGIRIRLTSASVS